MALGGPGFGDTLAGLELERGVKSKELKLKSRELDQKLMALGQQDKQNQLMVLLDRFDKSAGRLAEYGKTVQALGSRFQVGSPLDRAIDMEKNVLAQLSTILGQDPGVAQGMADWARSGAGVQKLRSVAPGGTVMDESSGEPVFTAPSPITTKTVEVPGEFGVTSIRETTGGPAPAAGAPAGGGTVASAGGSAAPGGPPPGQGGKPLPKDAQEAITGGLASLKSLDDMEGNIGQTGVVRGRVSNVQKAVGANKGAIDFDTARNNFKLSAQSIIKGIPSNFDVGTLIDTLPDMTLPQSVNRSRITFARDMIKQLIADTVGYYKYTGARIPPDILAQARKAGVTVDDVPAWDGKGTPTAKSERMLAGGGKKEGIPGMSVSDLLKLDPKALSPADRKALEKRLDDLGL